MGPWTWILLIVVLVLLFAAAAGGMRFDMLIAEVREFIARHHHPKTGG